MWSRNCVSFKTITQFSTWSINCPSFKSITQSGLRSRNNVRFKFKYAFLIHIRFLTIIDGLIVFLLDFLLHRERFVCLYSCNYRFILLLYLKLRIQAALPKLLIFLADSFTKSIDVQRQMFLASIHVYD